MAEARSEKPEGDLNEILQYIEEKEKTLSNYSDKLRASLTKFFNIFGSPNYCQVCGGFVDEQDGRRHARKEKDTHEFKPKMRLSLKLKGEDFRDEKVDNCETRTYYLLSKDGRLVIGIDRITPYQRTHHEDATPNDVSRETLKQLIKTGALRKFFEQYKDKLNEENEEFQEVSEIAEKIANVIQ